MAETIGSVIGTIIGIALIMAIVAAPFALVYFVRRKKRVTRSRHRAGPDARSTPAKADKADSTPPDAQAAPITPSTIQPTEKGRQPVRKGTVAPNGWISAGHPVDVAGYEISAGLFYVGRKLDTGRGVREPSLIDPSLRVNSRRPDKAGRWLDYWPSYAGLHPESRAAYLDWLARGRRDPQTPIGYVFLFMYGLERRVLIDIAQDKTLLPEAEAIRAELSELLALHGENRSFNSYASSFVDVLDLMLLQDDDGRPIELTDLSQDRWDAPLTLRVKLGSLAADRQPVPAEWALRWAWFHPSSRIRTAATRCFEEFVAVFDTLYRREHGNGIVPANSGPSIGVGYHAASAAIGSAQITMDGVKDVLTARGSDVLVDLVDRAQASLDAYSRLIGKHPEAAGTLRATALLPIELLSPEHEVTAAFSTWLSVRAAHSQPALGSELLDLWDLGASDKASKQDSVLMAQLADKLGYGLEPDARFGGPVYDSTAPVRVFAQPSQASHTPSPEYQTATTAAHLAVAVGAADGSVSVSETQTLLQHIESRLDLPEWERIRLEMHARWLADSPVKLSGLGKRLAALSHAQRESLGHLMIGVALDDGVVTPDEVRTVSKVFKLLGLDEDSVTSRLHQRMTGAPDPVLVRHASPEAGVPVPARPANEKDVHPGFVLDSASIERKLQDTASVSALLRDIFDEENAPPVPLPGRRRLVADEVAPAPVPPASSAAAVTLPGLDGPHTDLVMRIGSEGQVSRSAFEEVCASLDLLPDGAIDILNEAAIDICEEPLVEGDDPMLINPYALEELKK